MRVQLFLLKVLGIAHDSLTDAATIGSITVSEQANDLNFADGFVQLQTLNYTR